MATTHPGKATTKRNSTGGSTRRKPATQARHVSREAIQKRAYEIHQEHGSRHGRDLDDWLQAERELQKVGTAKK